MKTMKCRQCGKIVKVDDFLYEKLKYTTVSCSNGKSIRTHEGQNIAELVISIPSGCWPDHINGDIHDNQKSNLRPATPQQNAGNRKTRKDSLSGYKGVFQNRYRGATSGKWTAYISKDGKMKSLGSYPTAEEAARRYDRAAIEKYGEFAKLNFPI